MKLNSEKGWGCVDSTIFNYNLFNTLGASPLINFSITYIDTIYDGLEKVFDYNNNYNGIEKVVFNRLL